MYPFLTSKKKILSTSLFLSPRAFTLSELIVVIVILAILGTIGFVSIQSYSAKSRDSTRVATIRTAVSGLTTKAIDLGRYPLPEGQISTGTIQGVEVAYKGEFGENIARAIRYSFPLPKDPLTDTPLPYGVSMNQKHFQIAATLENSLGAYSGDSSGVPSLNSINSYSFNVKSTGQVSFVPFSDEVSNLNPLRIEETSAATPASAKVDGSYPGYIKFSSGSATYIANFPSLIWFGAGTIDFTPPAPSARFVRDGGENVPYAFSSGTPLLPETPEQSVRAITKAPTASFVGTEVTGIEDSLTLKTIFTGSILENYGTSVPTIEVMVLGTTDKLPKGPITPVGGVCSTTTAYVCTTGASAANVAGSCGGNATWTCIGSLGGANTSCSLANPPCPIAGVCGTAHTVATTSAPSASPTTNLCTTGTPTAVSTNTADFSWSCTGVHGGATASCSAPRQYTVTFDGNGGSGHTPTSKTLTYNTAIGTLPTPAYTNYSWNGWFTAPTGGTQITASTTVSGTTTYSAQWTAVTLHCTLPWGGTIVNGASVTAYSSSSATSPTTCASISQTRTCTNGVLSGSNTSQTCSQQYRNCTGTPWGTVAHEYSNNAYSTTSVACGGSCSSYIQTRTCNDGTMSGSFGNASCSVASCTSCNLPGYGTLSHGQGVTSYNASSVSCGSSCSQSYISCNNGSLSGGSYYYGSCSVATCCQPSGYVYDNYHWNTIFYPTGHTFTHGISVTYCQGTSPINYTSWPSASGGCCSGQFVMTNNGIIQSAASSSCGLASYIYRIQCQ